MPFHVVFDNPPLKMDDWVRLACEKARLTLVDNAAISKAMAADPESLKVLATPGINAYGPDRPKLAPVYRKALEQLHGSTPRRGLYSSAWLEYVDDVQAYILDWSEIERLAKQIESSPVPAGVKSDAKMEAVYLRNQNTKALRERIKATIPQGRVLELKAGLTPAEKVQQAVEFIHSME